MGGSRGGQTRRLGVGAWTGRAWGALHCGSGLINKKIIIVVGEDGGEGGKARAVSSASHTHSRDK